MAGGKETGRQKMVSMMYLVLTALLALNVSMTVIDKFVFIDGSLVSANSESAERNESILKNIAKTVDETGSREADLKVAKAAEEIREETKRIMTELNVLKDSMIAITGLYQDGHIPEYPGDARHLTGKTDYSTVGHYMLPVDVGGQGKGDELAIVLNGYAEFIKAKMAEFKAPDTELSSYKKIAVDAEEDPLYSKDENQKGKKFAQLAFEESPTPACLATVSEYQSRILSYETRALDYLSRKVGAGDMKFDKIVAMVNPQSKYVAAGTPYKAEMFIAASSSGVTPTMSYDGRQIPVSNGVGLVEFTATPGQYDASGNARKTFEASITVPIPGGGDTTYKSVVEYFVVEPVIQIQSKSVDALYLNCGNNLNVQVPALGLTYSPVFTATGGDTYKGTKTGEVTVVPTSAKVVLNIASSGNKIGSKEFGVRPIPAPEIKAFTDAGEVNMKAGISAKTQKLYLRAIPDEGFASFLPDDAAFIVAEAEITLVSGGLGRTVVRSNNTANLGQIAASARKGDVLSIEIKKVQRQNFKKQVEDFPRYNKFIQITLN
jgi:gliding motility-associated protein GldM